MLKGVYAVVEGTEHCHITTNVAVQNEHSIIWEKQFKD
jgi:hypothetical protein